MDNDDYTAKMTELIELLRVIGNDTQQCEVKECKRRISSTITETLSAFSNGNGGYIILGLSEKAGFTPVEGFDARAMQEALSQACEKLTPVVRPVIVTCPFEGANLVFAVIDEMLPREKPCFVSSVGPHDGSYIRTGDGDRKMTSYEVDRLLDEQRQPEHDIAVVPEATLDDLNPTLVHALLECERDRHPHVFAERSDMDMMLDLRILRRMPTGHPADDTVKHAADCDPAGIASREDDTDIGADTDTDEETRIASVPRPTLAGLLAVGRYPQKFFPRLNVTIAVYPGTSRDDVFTGDARLVASETITGPIPIMIDDAVASLMVWTSGPGGADSGAQPSQSPQPPMYPQLVLREAIANALTHRDYSPDALGTPVHVDVFTDRIEVSNLGGLFGAVSKQRLTHEASTSTRNAFLFSLLRSTPYPDGGTVLRADGTGYLRIGAALTGAQRQFARSVPRHHSRPCGDRTVRRQRPSRDKASAWMQCWKVKTRLTMLMIGPTNTAEITVPMPTPRNPWKKINDSTAAMMISVMSNTAFTVPTRTPLTLAMARTTPSPGTTTTFGASSMTMPKANATQPKPMHRNCSHSMVGYRTPRMAMLTSIMALNSTLTMICRNWEGLKSRRSSTT